MQAHIFFSGTVQGVGFRYTTSRFAKDLNLTGWVRNLSDGRVEILARGRKESIEQLCQELDRHFEGYIKSKELELDETSTMTLKDFRIA